MPQDVSQQVSSEEVSAGEASERVSPKTVWIGGLIGIAVIALAMRIGIIRRGS